MFTMNQLVSPFRGYSVKPANFGLFRSYASKATVKADNTASSKKKAVAAKKAAPKVPKVIKNLIQKVEKEVAPNMARQFKLSSLSIKQTKSPWVYFVIANKEKFKGDGDVKRPIGEVAKELGEKWRALSEQEKKPFNDEAAQEKKRLEKERTDILNKATPQDFKIENALRKARGKPMLKHPKAPKKPKNGYMYFAAAEREKDQNSRPIIEAAKFTGLMWNRMTPREKLPYEDKAILDRIRYANEMKAFNPNWVPSKPKETSQKPTV